MIQISKYEHWDFHRHPHLLCGGDSGSGKSRFLYGLIDRLLDVTSEENIYVADAKFEELEEVARDILRLPNVSASTDDIMDIVSHVLTEMRRRHSEKLRNEAPLFLIVDEYMALRLKLKKEPFIELEDNLKEIILLGRSVNVHIVIAMQRVDSKSIDLSIRDNMAIRIGFGNLSAENFKMLFKESRNEHEIENKNFGEGYVKIGGEEVRSFTAPRVWLSADEKPPAKKKWSPLQRKKA